jgi:hypothetical protein
VAISDLNGDRVESGAWWGEQLTAGQDVTALARWVSGARRGIGNFVVPAGRCPGANVGTDRERPRATGIGPNEANLAHVTLVQRRVQEGLDAPQDDAVRGRVVAGLTADERSLLGGAVNGEDRIEAETELDQREQPDEHDGDDEGEFDQRYAPVTSILR